MRAAAPGQGDAAGDTTDAGTWLIAGRDTSAAEELAATVPGAVTLDPSADEQVWQRAFADAAERGAPVTGIVYRSSGHLSSGHPDSDEPTDALTARLEAEVSTLLAAAHTALSEAKPSLSGGLWIITERAMATEPGELVDPGQTALWGIGRDRDRRAADAALPPRGHRRIRGPGGLALRRARFSRARFRHGGTRNGGATGEVPGTPVTALDPQRPTPDATQRRLRPGPDGTGRDRQPPADRGRCRGAGRQ